MKIRCNREHLADRLAQAARAASTRANLQSAAHVRLTAESSELPVELAATDLDALAESVEGVFVAAYDAEGLLWWEPSVERRG